MPRAIWNGAVIAESEDTVRVEGNHYFPLASVNRDYLVESGTRTVCPWKGVASYYTLEVDGERNVDAAWFYPQPRRAAEQVRGRVAFWHGVEVVATEQERVARAGRRGFRARFLGAAL